MPNELLSHHNVLSCFVELSCLRHSEVVALDIVTMLLEELCEHLSPLVCWVTPVAGWEHDVDVICANLILICLDYSDCGLINHDSACTRFLASNIEFTIAISVYLELRDGTEGQADSILNT